MKHTVYTETEKEAFIYIYLHITYNNIIVINSCIDISVVKIFRRSPVNKICQIFVLLIRDDTIHLDVWLCIDFGDTLTE